MIVTNRPTVQQLEAIMGIEIPVLDHGFVTLKDYMGDDNEIIKAARESTGGELKGAKADRGLARFLMRRKHTSPFEMCEIKLECQMPIFVARDWIRHRTANVNEFSARMAQLQPYFYLPNPEDVTKQSPIEKQGGAEVVNIAIAEEFNRRTEAANAIAYETYQWALDNDIRFDLSRINVPVNIYTKWVWKIDLHNLLHFLLLRNNTAAQWEFQQYAKVIEQIVAVWVPVAYQAYLDFQKNAYSLSAPAFDVIKELLHGEMVTWDSRMSNREWDEIIEKFNIRERIIR